MIDEIISKPEVESFKVLVNHVSKDTFPLSSSKDIFIHLISNIKKIKKKDLLYDIYEALIKELIGKQDRFEDADYFFRS